MHVCVLSSFSHVQLFATLWTAAHQVSLSMGFSRQEHWSGLPRPPAGDLSGPGMELWSYALQADSLLYEPPGKASIVIFLNLKTKPKKTLTTKKT